MDTISQRIKDGKIFTTVRYRFLLKHIVSPIFPVKENQTQYPVYVEISVLNYIMDNENAVILIEYKSGTDAGVRKWVSASDFDSMEIIKDFTDYTCQEIPNIEFICS